MKIVKPSAQIWENTDNDKHAVRCAQVCYASETNIENPKTWLESKKKNGHLSIFRHQTYYYIIPSVVITNKMRDFFINSPYVGFYENNEWGFISANGQVIIDNPWFNHLYKYSSSELGLLSLAEEEHCTANVENIIRKTIMIVTQISTSRELNRVSPNNICEQSTRFCNYTADKFDGEVAICEPWWYNQDIYSEIIKHRLIESMTISTDSYNYLVKIGVRPQDARGVLPLDTATKAVYTYRIEEWRHILDLRYYGITGTPHPNAKIIANLIRKELNKTLIHIYFPEEL